MDTEVHVGDKVMLVSPSTPNQVPYVGDLCEVLLTKGMEGFNPIDENGNKVDYDLLLIPCDIDRMNNSIYAYSSNVVKIDKDEDLMMYCSKCISIYSQYVTNFSDTLHDTIIKTKDD